MNNIATFIAINRYGLGAAPDEAARVADDPRGWLKAQVQRKQMVPTSLARFRSSASMLSDIHNARLKGPEYLRQTAGGLYRTAFGPEVAARAKHMIGTSDPFAERMVLFWSNHFTVSLTRRIIGPAIPAYEREAIRPHIFGRFEDMLIAVCQHNCMISYLDNLISMGPNSKVGRLRIRRTGNKKTVNENLAREILELHTVGVNGGYTQKDVVELARVLTGWSHGGLRLRRGPYRDDRPVHGGFEFKPEFHEPGPKTILGKTYRENGVNEGLAVLRDLVRHPSTARFIATKLVRHFVSDTPPSGAVRKIAAVFRQTEGDLAAVSRAVIDLDEAWKEPIPKIKSHYELVISTHRATGNTKVSPKAVLSPLREFGQVPFSAPSPAGWGDTAKDWLSPESLMRRIKWVRRHTATLPATLRPASVLEDTLGPVATDATRTWVGRAPSGDAALALVFSSPEFQRR